MPRATKKTEVENNINMDVEIQEKLKYIGLDIEKIPQVLLKKEEIKYRPVKNYDDTSYKVYKYIDVKDIQILITPGERFDDLNEKFKKADYLSSYIQIDNKDSLEKSIIFFKMLKSLDLDRLKEIEKEQESYQKQMPYEIKYKNNFIWQIFYSPSSDNYFMLFPSNEKQVESLFYLIKRKIQAEKSKKQEYIYVPVSQEEYTIDFLKKSEMNDLENYLWLFTNEWPNIYEVYDKDNSKTIQILGTTQVYEKIKSKYKIVLSSKEGAIKEFKRIKALFILQSEKPSEYNFKTVVNIDGGLDFFFGYKNITYEALTDFIKQEYLMKKVELQKLLDEVIFQKESLELLEKTVQKQNEEYLIKEKQITTFLECKKSFIGKVKYFFKTKKALKKTQEEKIKELVEEKNIEEKEVEPVITEEIEKLFIEKDVYTIEDLLRIGNAFEMEEKEYKNAQMDIKALENKKENLARKIKNATLYINEIESHKKSIFDFWKYTNKDEVPLIMEGEAPEEKVVKEKLKRPFNYEEDIEDFAKKVDETQRERFSKNECDAIFAFRNAPETFNIVDKEKILKKEKNQIEKTLENLKDEYEQDIEILEKKDFDIFGNVVEDKTKVKTLKNNKHREIEKDKYKILEIKPTTQVEKFMENIKNYKILLKEAYEKMTASCDISMYKVNEENKPSTGFELLQINPETAIKEYKTKANEINLHRYDLKEGMNAIFYSNIIFYDNINNTLPTGMDVAEEAIVNLDKYEVKLISRKDFRINEMQNEFLNKIKVIHVYEYRVELPNLNTNNLEKTEN